jgi:8-oxo-dGTP pyrophosphatase MutT (NUDIX family)
MTDNNPLKRFNIRVYGLLVHNEKVLLVDECVAGSRITKFPGGGLELGEGPEECVVREFREETGFQVQVVSHVYTTGFFQPSAFNSEDQIVSIYYQVACRDGRSPEVFDIPYESHSAGENILDFRWFPLDAINLDEVSLPIDRYVVTHCIPVLRGSSQPG